MLIDNAKLDIYGQKSLLIEFTVSTQLLIIDVIRDPKFSNYEPFCGVNSLIEEQWELSEIKYQLYKNKPNSQHYEKIGVRITGINKKYMSLKNDLIDKEDGC